MPIKKSGLKLKKSGKNTKSGLVKSKSSSSIRPKSSLKSRTVKVKKYQKFNLLEI